MGGDVVPAGRIDQPVHARPGTADPFEWSRRTPEAFARVLEETRSPVYVYGSAGAGLLRLMTLAGRLSFGLGRAGLTAWEASLVEEVLGRDDHELLDPHTPGGVAGVVVTHSEMGKVSLRRPDEPIDPRDTVIGSIAVAPEILDRAAEAAREEALVEADERAELDDWLEAQERGGTLPEVVGDVLDWIEHVEAVYVYVERRLFARSDVANTLVRGGILKRLLAAPLDSWTPEEKLFIAAFHVLYRSGRSVRAEEFNGQRISATRLRAWLSTKLASYQSAMRMPRDPTPPGLFELAEKVAQLRAALETRGWSTYRRINGLTLVKQERMCPVGELAGEGRWPETMSRLTKDLGLSPAEEGDSVATATACAVLDEALRVGNAAPIHRFVETVVASAVLEADADYGMSSSIRHFARLRLDDPSGTDEVLKLVKADFFCACLPHPGLPAHVPREVLYEVLLRAAQRMQYNRWHFIVGNFNRSEVPSKRHYYYPPVTPDIAEWADLRHPGHTSAAVRYTIRSPGPSMWREPLNAFGRLYRGSFDVRLVRMDGPPFTPNAIAVAVAHTQFLDAFWREVARRSAAGVQDFVVDGFNQDYYEDERWRLLGLYGSGEPEVSLTLPSDRHDRAPQGV